MPRDLVPLNEAPLTMTEVADALQDALEIAVEALTRVNDISREAGPVGPSGRDGVDGNAGPAGADGVGIMAAAVTADGCLVQTLTDGRVLQLGNVRGPAGERGPRGERGTDGKDGRGIAALRIEDGALHVEFTDGVTASLGPVSGVDGKDGKDGADGKDGVDGRDGRDGVDGKDGVDGRDVDATLIAAMQMRIDDLTKEVAALRPASTEADPEFAVRVQSLLGQQ